MLEESAGCQVVPSVRQECPVRSRSRCADYNKQSSRPDYPFARLPSKDHEMQSNMVIKTQTMPNLSPIIVARHSLPHYRSSLPSGIFPQTSTIEYR